MPHSPVEHDEVDMGKLSNMLASQRGMVISRLATLSMPLLLAAIAVMGGFIFNDFAGKQQRTDDAVAGVKQQLTDIDRRTTVLETTIPYTRADQSAFQSSATAAQTELKLGLGKVSEKVDDLRADVGQIKVTLDFLRARLSPATATVLRPAPGYQAPQDDVRRVANSQPGVEPLMDWGGDGLDGEATGFARGAEPHNSFGSVAGGKDASSAEGAGDCVGSDRFPRCIGQAQAPAFAGFFALSAARKLPPTP